MSFSYDIQTSSCLKPPDPFMLRLCHSKQQPSDSDGGVWFGPQIFLMGSLDANKALFFTEFGVAGMWPVQFQGDSVCGALEMCSRKFEDVCARFIWVLCHSVSSKWLKASGRVLFMNVDIFKDNTALSKPSSSYINAAQTDLFLRKK